MNRRGIVKIVVGLIIFLVVAFVAVGVLGFYWLKNLTPEKIINSDLVRKSLESSNQDLLKNLPAVLGYTKPMTYLVLFENNTELRPGGGFIGVYAVIKLDKGKTQILKIDGTENLDRNVPADFKTVPPQPITDYLKVKNWYFRDSNWSPDFGETAKKALELYNAENGVGKGEIDAVLAFTPTVLENLLGTTGPVTVQGIEFNKDNVTEKLEYEVEYGYDDKGIAIHERKQIIEPLLLALMDKLKGGLFFNLNLYINLVKDLVNGKQVMAYSSNETLQKMINDFGAAGQVKNVPGDYLMWVDANLAALKTDHAITRTLNYGVSKQQDGQILAIAEMEYKNNGKFDWRTTRYRTYVRVFVPLGAKLSGVQEFLGTTKIKHVANVDQGIELGKQWFGTFLNVEPGTTKILQFGYYLPDNIIAPNAYSLLVQKQLGVINEGLTLGLYFDKNIITANPAEVQTEWGDKVYRYTTALDQDRVFQVGF